MVDSMTLVMLEVDSTTLEVDSTTLGTLEVDSMTLWVDSTTLVILEVYGTTLVIREDLPMRLHHLRYAWSRTARIKTMAPFKQAISHRVSMIGNMEHMVARRTSLE